jgi:hypothetical protein
MAPPAIVGELVERFQTHRGDYRNGRYNEAQLREEFVVGTLRVPSAAQ